MQNSMRTVFLHYHLFKNAGTSLDAILKAHFKERWLTQEFSSVGGNNTHLIEDWIRATSEGVIYSTHTAIGLMPQVEDVRIIPLILLRDPVKRIISAYEFERQQQVDNWGANLAKSTDFEGYVTTRLAIRNDRQCRNFQTSRLGSLQDGDAPEIQRALMGLEMIHAKGLIGLVSDFDAFIANLNVLVTQIDPSFKAKAVHSNVSKKSGVPPDPAVIDMLTQANHDDAQVLAHAEALLRRVG